MSPIDPRYVAARRVLLDALLALESHADALIIAGARGPRSLTANVARPAALLVAKAHKIHDRTSRARPDRIVDKDAADVLRLMQTTSPATVGVTLARLAADPMAGGASTAAIGYLEALFGRRGRPGIEMASRATRLAIPAARVEAICVAYMNALLHAAR